MINLTYRIIKFTKVNKYVGLAWDYDHGQLMATCPIESYATARQELEQYALGRGCELRWFDGDYVCNDASGEIVSDDGIVIDTGLSNSFLRTGVKL